MCVMRLKISLKLAKYAVKINLFIKKKNNAKRRNFNQYRALH